TNRMTTVASRREEIASMPARFSEGRWEQYKKDARFFREVMGERSWWATMADLDIWIWVTLLLMCVAQYFGTLVDLRMKFYVSSVLLMFGWNAILAATLWRDEVGRWLHTLMSNRRRTVAAVGSPGSTPDALPAHNVLE